MHRRAALAIATALLALAGAPATHAYTFGEPGVRATGPEVLAFDWTTQKCNTDDIPDQATKAFRDVNNQVVMINSHHTTRRYQGATLATVTHNCSIMMGSSKNPDPSMFNDREWLGTTWTPDGSTVYGLIHSEYQGYNHEPDGFCIRAGETFADKQKCWYNTLTLTMSTDNGATFHHAPAPTHFVAGPAYQYARGIGPLGFFQPSNIVRGRDGFLYILAHVQDYGAQPVGSCLMRTNNIEDPRSWRMWGGAGIGFVRTSVDPYRTTILDPAQHVCVPVANVGTMSESLTWNTYFKKWMLVGAWQGPSPSPYPDSGFYYFTSDDMLNWSPPKLLMNGRLPWTWRCSDGPEQVRDPSVLDTDSLSRNFDTVGQRPFIYFTRFNISGCSTTLDRDLVRIPFEFSNQQPGGPAAALSASSETPQTGETVTFDASGSSDDGKIMAFKWDLDGNGTYERDTGTNPVTSDTYGEAKRVTVTVRVCDDDAKATDETVVLDVGNAQPSEPLLRSGAGAGTGECPPPQPLARGGSGPSQAPPVTASTTAGIGLFKVVGRPVSRTDGSVVLRVKVPSAGLLTVRGVGSRKQIRSARVIAAEAGTVRVTLRPSLAARRLLRRKHRVKAEARLVFTPVGGEAQRSTRVLMLRRARAR